MREKKDIEKRDPNKPRYKVFFELFFRKFWTLCRLNIVYLLFLIPTFVVTLMAAGTVSGVLKEAAEPILAKVLELEGPDMNNVVYAQNIFMLDFITRIIITLAVVALWGLGPISAGYTYVQRNYAREEHAWLFSDMMRHTKRNFRQALVVWVVDLLVFLVLFNAYFFYSSQGGFGIFKYLIAFAFIVYTVMHFYIYPLMVTFKLSLKDIYRNSLLFVFLEAPRNLLVLLIVGFFYIGIPVIGLVFAWGAAAWTVYLLISILGLVALTGFLVNFSVYPTIEKYIFEAEKMKIEE